MTQTNHGPQSPVRRVGTVAGLAAWLLLCFAAAALGSFFRPDTWFAQLQKPAWQPPNWLFAPVWTVLYTLMGVAAWLVWRQGGWAAQSGRLRVFLLQLLLNAAWSPLFFGLHRPGWALVDLVLLWIAVGYTLVTFRQASVWAALLLAPYWAWLTFAAVLNFTLWRLNP